MFLGIFLGKSLVGIVFLRTFAPAFAQKMRRVSRRESSLKDLHRQK